MKTRVNILFFFIFSFLYINVSAQDSINYKNPLWAFDYLISSWKAQIPFCEIEYNIKKDSIYVSSEYRDFYGQALMTICTLNGNISYKDTIANDFRDKISNLSILENENIDIYDIKPQKILIEEAQKKDIMMINEAHLYPQHRAFMSSLLEDLYNVGYRHLFLEALSSDCTSEYPLKNMGIYVCEPTFANLIRKAILLGFTINSYDGYATSNRDSISAVNICKKINDFNRTGKSIIYCGFEHNNEFMPHSVAFYLQKILNIDIMTVDQTLFSEAESSIFYEKILNNYCIDKPAVLQGGTWENIKNRNAWGQDYYIISPKTSYKYGYPIWVIDEASTWILNDVMEYDCVEVFYDDEYEKLIDPIPFSVKYHKKSNLTEKDKILVPMNHEYKVIYSKIRDGSKEIIKII